MQIYRRQLLLSTIGTLTLATIASADPLSSGLKNGRSGAVFIMTNNAANNEIISYERSSDGQLFAGDRIATGGRGSGGINDPLQSQGSLVLSQDRSLLFAANAGSGTVSVFRVKGASLRLMDQTSSGGSEPLAIAQNGDLVYVLNGAAAGSVVGFRWNDRQLRQIPNASAFLSGSSAGGSSLTISPDRTTLVVTERLTNNIDTFPIHADGTLGTRIVHHSSSPGVFSASFAPDGTLLVSETGPAGGTNASAVSSYRVLSDSTLSAISQSVPTLGAANCWNAITPDGHWVYVSNAGSDNISGFTISQGGGLIPIGATVVGINPPGTGNLDIAVSADSQYVYTLNSASGTISIFRIQQDGSLTGYGELSGLPQAVGFNGIAVL
jgi:6-phosphogluconolactonase